MLTDSLDLRLRETLAKPIATQIKIQVKQYVESKLTV